MPASSFTNQPESWILWVCLVSWFVPTGHPVLGPPSSLHTSTKENMLFLSLGWKFDFLIAWCSDFICVNYDFAISWPSSSRLMRASEPLVASVFLFSLSSWHWDTSTPSSLRKVTNWYLPASAYLLSSLFPKCPLQWLLLWFSPQPGEAHTCRPTQTIHWSF